MKKITIIGGDNRLKILKNSLEKSGYTVDSIGLFENDNGDIASSQTVILPVPTTKDKATVFTPLTNQVISLKEIEEKTTREQLILCCNYCFTNKNCIDYGSLNSYALLNSVPTAEGALKIAIENTDYTLWKSTALVIGYGRVGKILADRLKAMGAKVTISARKLSDLALAETLGFSYINTNQLNLVPLNYNIIFNTVDALVIDDTSLSSCTADLMIDLSTSGGFSLAKAEQLGIKAIKAPGLPSKIAPKTASEILCNTINNILNSSYDRT